MDKVNEFIKNRLSRRSFMAGAGTAAAGALLVGCNDATAPTTPTSPVTPPPPEGAEARCYAIRAEAHVAAPAPFRRLVTARTLFQR